MNIKIITYCTLITLIAIATACKDDKLYHEMRRIKEVGNSDPELALKMLDSIEAEVKNYGKNTRYSYDLLRIRLNDKAEKIPTSDKELRDVLAYYEKHGNEAEKQEAYYYAGSVYRDLQDTPRALDYFNHSRDYVRDTDGEYDTLMLRNTYSNLCYLYYYVQDFKESAIMAEKELSIAKSLKSELIIPYTHIASAYLNLNEIKKAAVACDSGFVYITKSGCTEKYEDYLVYLMNYYSRMGKLTDAKKCYDLIKDKLKENLPYTQFAFATYYCENGNLTNAIECYNRVLDNNKDVFCSYDAVKELYKANRKIGNDKEALRYADLHLSLSDSIDFGKRQELSATVRNQYKYQKDKERESKLEAENQRFNNLIVIISSSFVVILCSLTLCFVLKRNKDLKRILKLTKQIKENKVQLEEQKHQLTQKIDQNRTMMRLLHQAELENEAKEVVNNLNMSANGLMNMTKENWKQLYNAVDELYPAFKESMIEHLGQFTEQHMQVCYLMRIGLTNLQIQHITNLSRVTVWRWVKKFNWINEQLNQT